MNGLITSVRYNRVVNLPISLAQTELRAAQTMQIATFALSVGQRLELRLLTISLINVLTPAVTPNIINTSMGLCSVGFYRGTMICSPLAFATITDQNSTVNPFAKCVVEGPGTYTVIVSNNTDNTDLAVTATGSAKLYF